MTQHNSLARIKFFETVVHHPNWKDSMAGNNERPVIDILSTLGYQINTDYQRQYPIGERFVVDFAFINEKVALEVDGKDHDRLPKKLSDRKRDSFLRSNEWVSLRIKDEDMKSVYRQSFFKSLIKDIVEERRLQYQQGELYHIDIPHYNDSDYD